MPRTSPLLRLLPALALLAACGSEGSSALPAAAALLAAQQTPVAVSADTTPPAVSGYPAAATYEGGATTIRVAASDAVGVVAVQAVYPPGTTVSLALSAGEWSGTVSVPGNGSTTGTDATVSVPVTARDAAGNSASATVVVTVAAAEAPPAL
ncbi:MAG: hypothetical protein L6R48_04355 [Planctomycetes bacterium]|nr:hypothetical protein [Planctomycetota bacterium]